MVETAKTSVVYLSSKTYDALHVVATTLGRDPNELAGDAVETYLAAQSWHGDHIALGLRQAKSGEFATDEEVSGAFAGRR